MNCLQYLLREILRNKFYKKNYIWVTNEKIKLSKSEKCFVLKKIDNGRVQCIIPIMKGEKFYKM